MYKLRQSSVFTYSLVLWMTSASSIYSLGIYIYIYSLVIGTQNYCLLLILNSDAIFGQKNNLCNTDPVLKSKKKMPSFAKITSQ